jgi:hypothetical protein
MVKLYQGHLMDAENRLKQLALAHKAGMKALDAWEKLDTPPDLSPLA